jgi:thioredoxin-related protein
MIRARRLTVLVAAMLLAGQLLPLGGTRAADSRDPERHFFNPNVGDLKADLSDARKARKKAILLVFEQEGCPGCLYMHRNVLNRADVQQFYREHFYNYSIDIHGAVPIRAFSGREHTEKSYAQSLAVRGTPTFAFYDLDGNEIVRLFGVIKDPAEFLLLGEFVASGAYKTRKFAEFRQEQKKGS